MNTIYGTFAVEEPIILELLNSPAMQRLKGIHQGGIVSYATNSQEYSRYDHCLGVYALLKLFNAPFEEQVAGLLHDVSHTVFSHIGDLVFNHKSSSHSYQDEIHNWYLEESGVHEILHKYGLSIASVHPKREDFCALDTDLPFMCADRIDYNLQCALASGRMTPDQLHALVGNLRFDGKIWYFEDILIAKQLGEISLHMTENLWGSPWGLLINIWMADALQRALEIDLVSKEELHFSMDEEIWNRLNLSEDPSIKKQLASVMEFAKLFEICPYGQEDLLLKGKFRGIDPFVKTKQGLVHLSTIDHEFAETYKKLKETMGRGWPVKLGDSAPRIKERFLEI